MAFTAVNISWKLSLKFSLFEMDLHRCRFIKYQPGAIHHLAATPSPYPNPLVAVARSSGDIEIWNTSGKPGILPQDPAALTSFFEGAVTKPNWTRMCTIPGSADASIESLCFSLSCSMESNLDRDQASEDEDDEENAMNIEPKEKYSSPKTPKDKSLVYAPRLFSCTLSGWIMEYNLDTLKVAACVDSNGGGAIWCMSVSPCYKWLAIGCEDGCVRLFDIQGGAGSIEYVRCFEKQRGRILSLSWGYCGTSLRLITGESDGMIRLWDPERGRSLQRMSVVNHSKRSTENDIYVWGVMFLDNDTFVSCDSTGCVKVWETRNCTIRQNFKTNDADVLSICTNDEKNVIYAAGVDAKIAQLSLVKKKWVMVQRRRIHTHDIRSLVWVQRRKPWAFDKKRKGSDVDSEESDAARTLKQPFLIDALVSGGIDSNLTVMLNPATSFNSQEVQPTRFSPFPAHSPITLCKSKRMILCHLENRLCLWSLGKSVQTEAIQQGFLPIAEETKFMAEIFLPEKNNVVCSALSDNGEWIFAGDVFGKQHLYRRDEQDGSIQNVSNRFEGLEIPFCQFAGFISHSTLVLISINKVFILKLNADGKVAVEKTMEYCSEDICSTSFAVSPCKSMFAVGNTLNHVALFVNEGGKKSWKKQDVEIGRSSIHTGLFFDKLSLSQSCKDNDGRMFLIIPTRTQNFGKQQKLGMKFYDVQHKSFVYTLEEGISHLKWISKRKDVILGVRSRVEQLPLFKGSEELVKKFVLYIHTVKWMARIVVPQLSHTTKKLLDAKSDAEKKPEAQDYQEEKYLNKIQNSVAISHHFDTLLHFDFLDSENLENLEAVAIERPWSAITEDMPPAYDEKRYGH